MIIDSLQNFEKYMSLNPLFEKAGQFLKTNDITKMEPGKYTIDGENIWANIVKSNLKKEEEARMEAHNTYIDIQICIDGEETFGWITRASCIQPTDSYNPEKDIIFFEDKATTFFTLQSREFTIFFPEDGHQPMIGKGKIHKCIIKIKA